MKNTFLNNIKKKLLIASSITGIILFTGCTHLQNTNTISSIPDKSKEVYEGHYYCLQGKTSLVLSINYKENNKLDAIFDFQVSDKIYGAFNMDGFYNKQNNKIYLFARNWTTNKPKTYTTVDLVGKIDESGNLFSGEVIGNHCTTFELRKVN
ncbi:hypothetical protein N5T96_11585 [Aliarcobacter butzleri]|uniref:hypothetical protein n=1 Tax=Aliarcobacter butzleri TaxID=28197 RepID=UPI0021B29DD6|nr:hypothetical protein [Aliarcobacter butzleri]MCT7566963.1 hypothetical protein [Aliarcobacter butzleri]MCT7573473.1 hypothetical protein [Aliarcobacter butzleri]